MKAKEKKKKVGAIRDNSVDSTKDDSGDERQRLNGGQAKDLAIEKYMFTDEDDENDTGIMVKKEAQRKQRNESEKKRKDNIKLGIRKISNLLPETYKNPKDNYVNMLDKTVSYIEELKQQNEQLLLGNKETAQEQEIERLKKQVADLELQRKDKDEFFQQLGPNVSADILRGLSEWKGKESNTKKGLEKFLATIMSENGTPDLDLSSLTVTPARKDKKKKSKKSPSGGVQESDMEGSVTSSCSLTGLLPEILPDGSMPPFPGFNMNQLTSMPSAVGIPPVLPQGLTSGSTMQITPDGLPNGPLYGSASSVPVITSTGKLVFMSPNSAHQSSSENVVATGPGQNNIENKPDVSFSDPSQSTEKIDSSQDTMNISDNPLLDPEMPSMDSFLSSPGQQPQSTTQGTSGKSPSSLVSQTSGTVNSPNVTAVTPIVQNPAGTVAQIPGLQVPPMAMGQQSTLPMLPGAITRLPGLPQGLQVPGVGLQGPGLTAMGTPGVPSVQGAQPAMPGTLPTGPGNTNPALQGTIVMQNGQLILINKSSAAGSTTPSVVTCTVSDVTMNNAAKSGAPPPASTALSVGTTLTPSTGIKMATTANPSNPAPPNLAGLQTQSVMINGQQQTVQVVPQQNQGMVPQNNSAGPSTANQQAANQTVTVNTPQGQVTMNTTPCQPNQLPSALILPNGQIVPVVTQPQTLFPQNQCVPVNGGLLVAGSQSQGVATPTVQPPVQSAAGKSGPIMMQPPMLGQPVLGAGGVTNVRAPVAQTGTTIRLPNGQLAIVPASVSNTSVVRPDGSNLKTPTNAVRSSNNTIHHLPMGATSMATTPGTSPLVMGGTPGAKIGASVPGQPLAQSGQMVTGLAGQIVVGPNGPYLQNVDAPDSSVPGQVPVATSGDTVPTSTTTESKSVSASSATMTTTSSAVNVPSLPQTVTAMLTPDGNIILLPSTSAISSSGTTTMTSAQVGKAAKGKNPRVLKPKPSSGGQTNSTTTTTTSCSQAPASSVAADSTSQWITDQQQAASPASCSVSSSTLGPLSISVSTDNQTPQSRESGDQDILAKAAESIFSSCGADISPGMGAFYQDDDNPLQIDTSNAVTSQSEEQGRMDPPPAPAKGKAKRPPRRKSDKSKKKTKADSKMDIVSESPSESQILDQLTDKMDDEGESNIDDFSDLIKMHDPSPPPETAKTSEDTQEAVAPDTTQLEIPAPTSVSVSIETSLQLIPSLPTMPQLLPSQARTLSQMQPKLSSPKPSISQMPFPDASNHEQFAQPMPQILPQFTTPQSMDQSANDSTNQPCSIEQVMAAMQGESPAPVSVSSSQPISTETSNFSSLNFLCTVAEQHQQEHQKPPTSTDNQQTTPPNNVSQQSVSAVPQMQNSAALSGSAPGVEEITAPTLNTSGPEQVSPPKKSKSSKKKKKDKKKNKEKHKNKHGDSKNADGSKAAQEGDGPTSGDPTTKPEKEKKKKKNKKKDKDKDREKKSKEQQQPPILTPVSENPLMPTVTEDGSSSTQFNLDQPVPTPMFYNLPDTPAPPPPVPDPLDNAMTFTAPVASLDESPMDLDASPTKSKSKRSRKKKEDGSVQDAPGERRMSLQEDGIPSNDGVKDNISDVHSDVCDSPSKKKGRKRPLCPDDVIPEEITFSVNELNDVLETVEHLGETLQPTAQETPAADPQNPSPPVKIVLDGTEAPLPKRKKGDSEVMEHLIIRPSCKKKEERVSEDKLNEVFGKKTPDRPGMLSPQIHDGTSDSGEIVSGGLESPIKVSPGEKKEKKKSKKSKKKNKDHSMLPNVEMHNSSLSEVESQGMSMNDSPLPPLMAPPSTMPPPATIPASKQSQDPSQAKISAIEVDLTRDFEPEKSVPSPPKLIDSLMNSGDDDMSETGFKESDVGSSSKGFQGFGEVDSLNDGSLRQPQSDEVGFHKKPMKDSTSLFDLDNKEEPKMTPARHSNIYSLASHMAPPKYGPIVQPKTPKPSLPLHRPSTPPPMPPANLNTLSSSEPGSSDGMASCSQPMDSTSPSTQMMEPTSQSHSKEHDLASSLPDELDIPDIVQERESELSQEQQQQQVTSQDDTWKIRSPNNNKKQEKIVPLSPAKKVHGSQNQYSPRQQHDNMRMDQSAEKENLNTAPQQHMSKNPSSSSSGRYSTSSDGMFSPPSGNQTKNSGTPGGGIINPCRDSPASAHNSGGGMTPVTMESPRDNPSSRPLSSGPGGGGSEMFGPMPPMSGASSCALQGRQLEHFPPFPTSSFPPISNPASTNRSSCSMGDSETPFSINFTTASSTAAYDSRHQFVYPPFPMGPTAQRVRPSSSPLGHGPPSSHSTHMPLRMDGPAYSRNTSSTGNMEIATSKHSMHPSTLERDKSLSHNMGPSGNPQNTRPMSGGRSMHGDNKTRDRDQQHRGSITAPPPQLSHPDKDLSMKGHDSHLSTSAHSQNQSSMKQRSSSIGRSPQDSHYMGPSSGNYSNQSPSLTSPPLHHPRPPSEPGRPGNHGNHRGNYDPLMFPGNGQHSQFSPSFPMYDPPPLHCTSKDSGPPTQSNTSYSQPRSSTSSNMPHNKQQTTGHGQNSGQRQSQGHSHHSSKMANQKQASSHHSSQPSHLSAPPSHQQSHHTQQQQNATPPAQTTKSSRSSKSSKSKSSASGGGTSSSGSTKQLQHYDAGDPSAGAMFDPSRSMTPYFPISNLSPQPRNLPGDAPTYLPGNFFPNTGRPLSNANSLQHNSFFPPSRAQNGIGLNFQTPSFPMNMHRDMHSSTGSNRSSSPSQITQHSSSVSMGAHMPNFNLNLFDPAQADISSMKFPPGNSIMPQGSGVEHNALQHHHQAAGSLYHNRSQVPPMLHNFNSFLGHQQVFEARGMGSAMNSSMGPPFGAPSHPPFGGMPHLNFIHDH